jgi:aspartyl/asparaginyl beta-hydroxylase (cupin superfamily)
MFLRCAPNAKVLTLLNGERDPTDQRNCVMHAVSDMPNRFPIRNRVLTPFLFQIKTQMHAYQYTKKKHKKLNKSYCFLFTLN